MINSKELEEALKNMQPRSKLYEMVRVEMIKRGRWKNKPRGKPMQKGSDDRRDK